MNRLVQFVAFAAVLASPTMAQDDESGLAPGDSGWSDRPQKLDWPRDRDRAICKVDGKLATLEDLVGHLERRHYPGMRKLLEFSSGKAYLATPLMARWVRQYADVLALEAEGRARGIDFEAVREQLANSLKLAFEQHLSQYRAERERHNRPIELTQQRIDILLSDFQRNEGLRTEVEGWLEALAPAVTGGTREELQMYYTDHPLWHGGRLSMLQILVQHRDPRTLELLTGKEREEAFARLADARARIAPDGSNFEDVARLLSEDRRTAAKGGLMENIRRFDQRLPAALCRAAWSLRDGEISAPFETPYGMHIIKRLGAEQRQFYAGVLTDAVQAEIRGVMTSERQEDLLFDVREKHSVVLYY